MIWVIYKIGYTVSVKSVLIPSMKSHPRHTWISCEIHNVSNIYI